MGLDAPDETGQEVVGSHDLAHIAFRGKASEFGSKVSFLRLEHVISAPGETLREEVPHGGAFRGKRAVVKDRVLRNQCLHSLHIDAATHQHDDPLYGICGQRRTG